MPLSNPGGPLRVGTISNANNQNRRRGNKPAEESKDDGLLDRVVKIKRCAAVVKGGRRFSFAAMVVVGDGQGRVGWGYGKANEVPPSVQKATKQATRDMINVPLVEGSIPHQVWGQFGAAKVTLIPAGAGTGIIAGQAVRAVCEACGIHDILTKSFGTNNPVTLVKATVDALSKLRTREEIAALRGISVEELSAH
ncbi:30S ribosomal protein S5 [Roseiconus lacunae]|uniref:30S ribosomal protein S5 n=1 Tax=Roseiconus lacunae TaxID=2605694 RepID=UPI003F53315C